MLDHHHRVARVAQFFERVDEASGVAAVQTDARFVEDVKAADERAAERCCQVDALALAAGKGVRRAVQGQIAEPDIEQELQSRAYLCQQAFGYFRFVCGQLQRVEPLFQFGNRHRCELRDVAAADFHVSRLLFQSQAAAFGTNCLASKTTEHNSILNFILLIFKHLEERVDAHAVGHRAVFFGRQTMPKPIFLLLRQFEIRRKKRELVVGRATAKFIAPDAHFLAVPALHATVVNRQRRVRNDKFFVDADGVAEAFANGACAGGRIEREHIV